MSRIQETITTPDTPVKLPMVVHGAAWEIFLTDLATELVYAIFPVSGMGNAEAVNTDKWGNRPPLPPAVD